MLHVDMATRKPHRRIQQAGKHSSIQSSSELEALMPLSQRIAGRRRKHSNHEQAQTDKNLLELSGYDEHRRWKRGRGSVVRETILFSFPSALRIVDQPLRLIRLRLIRLRHIKARHSRSLLILLLQVPRFCLLSFGLLRHSNPRFISSQVLVKTSLL